MSKFFKWLKKDKQQEKTPVVNEELPQMTEEQVNAGSESIKNDSSTSVSTDNRTIAKQQQEVQSELAETNSDLESPSLIKKGLGTDSIEIENSHSYIDSDIKDGLETSLQVAELESETERVATKPILENSPCVANDAPLPKTAITQNEATEKDLDIASIEQQNVEKIGFFSKLKRGLSRTKERFGSGIIGLFRGKAIDDELFEELETQLLIADVGIDTTVKIIKQLTDSSDRKQLKDGEALYQLLKIRMADILHKVESPLTLEAESGPFVILMVGVNGVGKTTTIGKMAKQFQMQGKKVMLAAGDTFRAAAVEQLEVWGERNNIPVVAQQTGSDSASVIYDAFQSAKAKNIDVLIADTAGRLQNKEHLMEELKKVVRVIKKIAPQAPHEIMLTLDAGTGQ
ncbi:MAG: signal recognition particle-docking protein FtsY, partial [Paraglaciecola sp.]|nr:signal recognition particle-docking protein FtsY [Paraglaciecola sp.]